MPGNRPHHSAKWHSCVEKVMAKGHDMDSAAAICTKSLIDWGTDIFEDRPNPDMRFDEATGELVALASSEVRELHLCGATGRSRVEMLDGREHLVVPVVALMEGVIHPVNAATPEFVPFATLEKAAPSWNGRPVTLGHPVKDGKQCSANEPTILASHGIGTIFKSRVEGKKLLCEAWIDVAKARQLNPEMYARLLNNKPEEVSVGAYVVVDGRPGIFNGREYKASWLETTGDHLAFLPNGRGACSIEMGCGTHRAAMHFVAAESIDLMPFDLLALAAKKVDCPACQGSGSANGNPCEVCDGTGELLKVAADAQRSLSNTEMIQAAHDHARKLGAACRESETQLRTAIIRHEGGRWILYTKDGTRKLGEHGSKADAEAQERAIEAALARRAAS